MTGVGWIAWNSYVNGKVQSAIAQQTLDTLQTTIQENKQIRRELVKIYGKLNERNAEDEKQTTIIINKSNERPSVDTVIDGNLLR